MKINLGNGEIDIYDSSLVGKKIIDETTRRHVAYGFVSVKENMGHLTVDFISRLNHATEDAMGKYPEEFNEKEKKFFSDLDKIIGDYYTK